MVINRPDAQATVHYFKVSKKVRSDSTNCQNRINDCRTPKRNNGADGLRIMLSTHLSRSRNAFVHAEKSSLSGYKAIFEPLYK